jgi:riboflavin kinase/FMN adenylyltransferase
MNVHRTHWRRTGRAAAALAIGNFDGVHRGHQALLQHLAAAARERRLASAVMTFEPHPREFFTPDRAPARISNLRDKVAAMKDCGIDQVFVQHFTRSFSLLTPDAFVENVVLQGCGARYLLVGDDFRFGAKRAGDVALLEGYAKHGAFELMVMPTITDGGERISSTGVRHALAAGDLVRASTLLGRAYAITGRVLHGRKLGRSLGFPTLNLKIPHTHPALQGIFAVRVHCLDQHALPGVASIGLRPAVDNAGHWLLEVHLFDFDDAAYGKLVSVEFVKKLRDEQTFDTLDALSAAIGADAVRARAVFAELDDRAVAS